MGLKDKLIAKLVETLQGLSQKYLDFIKKPEGYLSVGIAVGALIDAALIGLRERMEEEISTSMSSGSDPLLTSLMAGRTDPSEEGFTEFAKQYVKRDPALRAISAYIDRDLSSDVASEIAIVCADPDSPERVEMVIKEIKSLPSSSVNGEDLISVVEKNTDFDTKLSSLIGNLSSKWDGSKAQEYAQTIQSILPYLFLAYTLFIQTKEWLNQNERPSRWFAKALSSRIRGIAGIISNFAEGTINEYTDRAEDIRNSTKGLIDSLKGVDVAIGALVIATALLESNLEELQSLSTDWLKSWVGSETCDSSLPEPSPDNFPVEGTTESLSLLDSSMFIPLSLEDTDLIAAAVSCQKVGDSYPSPRALVDEEAASDVNCQVANLPTFPSESPLSGLSSVAPQPSPSTRAVYEYLPSAKSNSTYTPLVHEGQTLAPEDPVFSIREGTSSDSDTRIIRSSIIGTVSAIDPSGKKAIVLEDIQTPEDRPLEEDLKDLNALYQEESNLKTFLKDWDIRLLYVPMLSKSPLIDTSLTSGGASVDIANYTSVEAQWEKYRKAQSGRNFDGTGGLDSSYDKDIQELTGEAEIKAHSENETLGELKTLISDREKQYYRDVKDLHSKAILQAARTRGDAPESTLYDWYTEILDELLATRSSQYDLDYEINTPPEEEEPIRNEALDWTISTITEFLSKRAFIDTSDPSALIDKIDIFGEDLDGGDYFTEMEETGTYFGVLEEAYRSARSAGKSGKEALKVTPGIIDRWGKGENAPDESEASSLRYRIYTIFSLYESINTIKEDEAIPDENAEEATAREGSILLSKLEYWWNKVDQIPGEVERILTKLDDQSSSYVPEAEGVYEGQPAKYFYVSDIPKNDSGEPCTAGGADPKNDLNGIAYWLKYCTWATLGSVTSPLSWATGLPPPIGPIPIPTIYIPIKGFSLPWGVVLIGITVTGVFPFPFVMIGNLSTSPVVPFADPATILRREAEAIKEGLIEELSNLKTITLEPAIERANDRVAELDAEISALEADIASLQGDKPRRDRAAETFGDKAVALATYAESLADWTATLNTMRASKAELSAQRYTAGLKAKILNDKLNDVATDFLIDPVIQAVEFSEEVIEKAFDALLKAIDAIDLFIRPLPISVAPMSASFAFTLKRPTPFTKIDDGFDDTVKTNVLKPFTDALDIENSALMNPGMRVLWDIKMTALDVVTTLLDGPLRITIVPIEPFPTYGNLHPLNLSWWGIPAAPVSPIGFIQPSWVSTGKKLYGIPGQP